MPRHAAGNHESQGREAGQGLPAWGQNPGISSRPSASGPRYIHPHSTHQTWAHVLTLQTSSQTHTHTHCFTLSHAHTDTCIHISKAPSHLCVGTRTYNTHTDTSMCASPPPRGTKGPIQMNIQESTLSHTRAYLHRLA